MKIELSIPPSANHLFVTLTQRGRTFRARSKEYKAWQDANAWPVRNECKRVDGPVRIIVTVHGGNGWNVRRDIENVLKPVCDLLVSAGVIPNDNVRYVREVRAVFVPAEEKEAVARCYCEVWAIGAPIDSFAKR